MFSTSSSRTSSTSSAAAHNFENGGSPSNGATTYSPTSILHQHSLPPFPTSITRAWGGVGGFTTPLQPAPPLCAPPLTVASSLGNPQMPTTSMYNSSSPMGYSFRMSSTNMAPACKRKPDDDIEDKYPSAKQHITEEKVSAGLNSLHLSTHFTSHTLGNSKNTDGSVLVKDCTDDSDSDSSNGTASDTSPRLYINTDIHKVSIENRSSLPETLLKNLKKDGPCLEVVLWQPRSQIISGTLLLEGGGSGQQPGDDLICEPGSTSATSSAVSSASNTTFSTSIASNSFANFFSSAGAGGSAISSPDSGVSISPPSNSTASFETTCEMDEDTFGSTIASLPKASNGRDGLPSSVAAFSSNPFSLFYPSSPDAAGASSAGGLGAATSGNASASASSPSSDLADLLLQNNNNNNNGSAASAYTRSWVEENNNTGLRDLNSRPNDTLPLRVDLLPPLPNDDDMDL